MEVAEHFYTDDPRQGPPDAKTTLDGVDYFFLGNGHIQAAVQVCTSGQATPVGLLILHPERLGPKRRALTFDPQTGLAPTAVTIRAGTRTFAPQAKALEAQWTEVGGVPAVRVAWKDGDLHVEETFYCPDQRSPRLVCVVRAKSSSDPIHGAFRMGPQAAPLDRPIERGGGARTAATLIYELHKSDHDWRVETRWSDQTPEHAEGARYWTRCATLTSSSPTLEHFFRAARNQLPAVVAASGMTDGGIWQYNLEWARDQAFVAATLATLGAVDVAQTMFDRLLTQFVSDEGDCVDSGRRRSPAEVELDQNGYLLTSLETYVNWTGDVDMLRRHWPRIQALAEFPLRAEFRHGPSGLLHNRREFWERHAIHGIQDGMELTHQLYTVLGLASAARLARLIDQQEPAPRWEQESRRIREAMLNDARYGLVENGRFIKRRDVSGAVQTTITPAAEGGLPDGIPLLGDGPHYLNPDTSTMLPIALEFITPWGELARNTLTDIEQLWNQRWDGGGYGRYHVSSEPDSPGPWPFPSLFVARAYFEAGDDDKVWRILNWLASAPGGRAGTWFEFYGPRPIPPYPQVGIIPWTWAEMACFFIHHLLGVRPGFAGLVLRPSLLAGLDSAEARLPLRGHTLHISLRRGRPGETPSCIVGGESHPYAPDRICLPAPTTDLDVQMVTPA